MIKLIPVLALLALSACQTGSYDPDRAQRVSNAFALGAAMTYVEPPRATYQPRNVTCQRLRHYDVTNCHAW